MFRALDLHSDSRCAAASRIEAEITRESASRLILDYRLSGRIADLAIPPLARPQRTDDLWRHTCFEAFIKSTDSLGYCEFNLSPSRAWAAYRFSGYRIGMAPALEIDEVIIETRLASDQLALRAVLDLAGFKDLVPAPLWRVGISAVIEETNGAKSYWALNHPAGKPDFHHLDGFVLDLLSAEPS